MAIKNKSKLSTLKKFKGGILPFLFIFFLAEMFFPASFSYADISENGHFQKTFFKLKNGIEKRFNSLDPYFEKTKPNASKNSKNKKPANISLELTQDIPALKPVKYLTAKLTSLEQTNENKTAKAKKNTDKKHTQTLSASPKPPAALTGIKTKTENIFSGFFNKIKNGFSLSEKNISKKIYSYQRAETYPAFNPKKAKKETQIIARAELAKDQIKSIAEIYESLNKEKTAKNFKVEGFVQNSRKISDPLLRRISDLEIKFLELKLNLANSTDKKSEGVNTSKDSENFNLRLDELNKAISDKATELRKEIQASASANLSVISLTNKISQLHQPTISAPTISSPVISAPTVSGNSNLETLTTSGLATLNSLSVSNAATLNSTLTVTGTTTLSGDLRADTSTLVLDALNNRLGVGTTSPQSPFSVAGIILFGEVSATSTNIGNENISQNLIVNRNFEVTGESTFSTFHSSAAGTSTISGILLSNSTSTFASQLLSNRIPNTPHSFSSWASGAENSQVQNSSFYINPASATGDTNLFGAAINDSVRFLVDAEGDVFANSVTLTGGSSLSTTSISTLTVENTANIGDAPNSDSHIIKGVVNLYATSSNSALSIWNSSSGDLLSLSGGATAPENHLTLTSSGNLGLGTSSPYAKLSVNGETVASYFTATSTAATSTFSGGFFVGSTTNPFLMVNRNSGNVGIGTSSPSKSLDINGDVQITPSNNTKSIQITMLSGPMALNSTSDFDWGLFRNGQARVRLYSAQTRISGGNAEETLNITNAGKVGIGTTTPNWLLQANGTRPFFTLSDSSAAADLKHWFMSSQGGNLYFGTTTDAYSTSTISALTILSNSNIGIGTSSPYTKLSIAGILAADSLNVNSSNATSTFSGGLLAATNGGAVGFGTTTPSTFFSVAGHCVTGDTRLRRRRKRLGKTSDVESLKTSDVEESRDDYIYDEVMIKDIQEGDEIASLDEKTGKIVWSRVNGLLDMGIKPIYKLTTASGKTIRTTGEHPYLARTKIVSKNQKILEYIQDLLARRPVELNHILNQEDQLVLRQRSTPVNFSLQNLRDYNYTNTQTKNNISIAKDVVPDPLFENVSLPKNQYNKYSELKNNINPVKNITVENLEESDYFADLQLEISNGVKYGKWTKVFALKTGQEIAVSSEDGLRAVWDTITKIEHLPSEQVYDIEVEGTHNFVAGHYINTKTGEALTEVQEEIYAAIKNLELKTKETSFEEDSFVTINLSVNHSSSPEFNKSIANKNNMSNDAVDKNQNGSVWSGRDSNPQFSDDEPNSLPINLPPRSGAVNSLYNTADLIQILKNKLQIPLEDIDFGGIVAHNTYINGGLGAGLTETTAGNISGSGRLAIQSITATSTFSTGGLTVGTSQFVVQQTSGNVGIGTTNPGAKLDVAGNIYVNNTIQNAATTHSYLTLGASPTVSELRGQVGVQISTRNSGNITLDTNPAGDGAGNVLITNGNVGIGTTSPNWLLQANGTRPFFTLSDSSAAADLKHWFMSSQGGNFYVGTSTDAYSTSTISALTINSNSRIGVGTTTPFEKFAVQGGIGADYLTITGATNATSTFSTGGLTVGTSQFVVQQTSGNVGIGTTSPATALDVYGAEIRLRNASPKLGLYDVSNNERTYLQMTSTGLTTLAADNSITLSPNNAGVVYLEGTGAVANSLVIKTGNVGIGTTSPGALFSVQGNGLFSGNLQVSGINATSTLTVQSTSATSTFSTGGLTVGTSQFVVQQTSGNVGIGTTTPKWLLQANDTRPFFTLSDTSSAANLKHWFMSSQGGNFYLGTSTDAYSTSTISALTINSNSRIGVGTTTPFEKFAVQGGIGADYLTITGATNATSTFSTGGLTVGTSQFVVQQTSGNVGIGTAGPTVPLDVNGKFKVSSGITGGTDGDNAITITNAFGDANTYTIGRNNSNGVLDFYGNQATYSGYLFKTSASTNALSIINNGNIGIGTTSPNWLLQANSTRPFFALSDTSAAANLKHWFMSSQGGNLYVGTSSDAYATSSVSRLTINSNGLLGLASSSPSSLLTVAGSSYFGTGAGDTLTVHAGTVNYRISATSTIPDNTMYAWSIGTTTTNDPPIFRIDTRAGSKATTSISGGFSVDSGAFEYDSTSGITSVDSLELGNLSFDTDGGIVSWTDMPVATTTADIIQSYTAQLDGENMLTVYGATDGSGGVKNLGIGIGTTTPDTLLTVNASSTNYNASTTILTLDSMLGDGSANAASGIGSGLMFRMTNSASSTVAAASIVGTLKTVTSGSEDGELTFFTRASGGALTERLRIDSAGKIGIGTTTPNWLLQANGTRPFFTLSDSSAGTNLKHWFLSSQGGNFYVGTSSDAYSTSTISALTINSNSRIGVGTTTPFEKFAVQGGLGADYLTITGATNATSTFSTGGINVGNGQFIIEQNSGKLGINTPVTASLITATTTLSAASGNEIAYQLNYTTNKAAGNDTGLLINMTDTASPESSLMIDGQVGGSTKFSVSNNGTVNAGNAYALGGGNVLVSNALYPNGNNITFTVYSSARTFTNAGDMLYLANSTYSNTSGASNAVSIKPTYNQTSGTAANTDLLIQRMELSIGSSTQYLLDLQSGNGVATTSRFNVTNIGKVGIGTTTPYWNMQISTTTPFLTLSDTSSAANLKHWFMSSQGGNLYFGTSSDAYATTTIPALMISKNGNVGIGTTTPEARLSIEGTCGDADTSGGCADIAELYLSSEAVETGEIVAVNNQDTRNNNQTNSITKESAMVKKASMGDTVIGIVSSNPAMAIEGSGLQFLAGTRYENNPMKPAVALAGRVPVKVSLEGGSIAPGDKITLSSVSGVGTKATTSGVTVGIALEQFPISNNQFPNNDQISNSQKIGKILVFVNLGYSKLDIAANDLEKALVVDFESGKIKSSYALDMANNDLLNVRNILSKSGKWSLDENGKLIVKEIETERLKIGSPDTPSGITIYDEETSEPYCIKMKGGQMVSTIGECGQNPQQLNFNSTQTENPVNSHGVSIDTESQLANRRPPEFNNSISSQNNLSNKNENGSVWSGRDSNPQFPDGRLNSLPISLPPRSGAVNSVYQNNISQTIVDTEPPVITINGNNPSVINVGVSYADLGAIVRDNVSNNLGINYKVDGVEVQEVSIDTSTSTTHTITYTAIDEAGNIGTAERKVIVEEITQAVIAEEAVLIDTASSTEKDF